MQNLLNILGPNEVNALVQATEKLKEKVAELEKEKMRFQIVMAEVRLGYETKIAQMDKAMQKMIGMQLLKELGQAGHLQQGAQTK